MAAENPLTRVLGSRETMANSPCRLYRQDQDVRSMS